MGCCGLVGCAWDVVGSDVDWYRVMECVLLHKDVSAKATLHI